MKRKKKNQNKKKKKKEREKEEKRRVQHTKMTMIIPEQHSSLSLQR
jgi:hypothetical protein